MKRVDHVSYRDPYPPLAADSRPIESDLLWTMHVLYFWKPLGTGMSEMMFPGVWHANTQTQIHKYSE